MERDFLRNTLLTNTASFVGHRDLNRHGVLHGVFVNFGHKANFYILISILEAQAVVRDYLCNKAYHATRQPRLR